jgi:hypothetical protein
MDKRARVASRALQQRWVERIALVSLLLMGAAWVAM